MAQTGDEIEQNTREQEEFNQAIQTGTNNADDLLDTVKNVVAAYATVETVKNILNISDELTLATARLDLMNDGLQSTQELVNMVYAAAQDSRGSFLDMADVVARFGNNAKDAFSSSEEVVAFADLIQKQMTIAGASTQEAANAELQLSQALGSGVLRGDELNSIFEQAPNLIQNIADYLDVPIGKIRDMASEGELSADVVKAAIFAASDDINAKFESMPMTWSDVWQSMQDTALIAFKPVFNKINELANSEALQNFINMAIEGLSTLSWMALEAFDLMISGAQFVADNWSVLEPIVMGVVTALAAYAAIATVVNAINAASAVIDATKAAADALAAGHTFLWTVNQYGLNAALAACPITWIIVGIIALIAVIFAVCQAIANMTGVANSGFGVICGIVVSAAAFIWNIIIGLVNTVITIGVELYNMIANFAAGLSILFNDPIAAIEVMFLSLFNFIVGIVKAAAGMLDAVFGSNLADAVAGFQDKVQTQINTTVESAGGSSANTLNASDYILDRVNYGNAFEIGASWGDGVADAVSNFSLTDALGIGSTDLPNTGDYVSGFNDAINNAINSSGLADSAGTTADNTSAIKDSVSVTEDELKYMRDIAEQEAVNRYTTAEINVDMSGMQNTVSSGMDLDGVVDGLTDAVNEAVDNMTEGVHK
jgi:tape measure domain-containing protein